VAIPAVRAGGLMHWRFWPAPARAPGALNTETIKVSVNAGWLIPRERTGPDTSSMGWSHRVKLPNSGAGAPPSPQACLSGKYSRRLAHALPLGVRADA